MQTVKFLENNIGENLLNPALGKEFRDLKPKAQSIKLLNWTSPKFKILLFKILYREDEKTSNRIGENIYKPHIQQRTSPEDIRNSQNSAAKQIIQLEKWAKKMRRHFYERT